MKEHPILFSAPMVRAILDGRKTQTRRVVKPQPLDGVRDSPFVKSGIEDRHGYEVKEKYAIGDRLWVRETWAKTCISPDGVCGGEECDYCSWDFRADDPTAKYPGDWPDNTPAHECPPRWKPSIFMPRAACRIWLEITDVRVERLRDISETDAQAEGVELGQMIGYGAILEKSYREAFLHLWNEINPKHSFDAWVWVITFIRL